MRKSVPVPACEKLRRQFERELVAAQNASDQDVETAGARLGLLSPWYAPPTDKEVAMTRTAVQNIVTKLKKTIAELQRNEANDPPWYADQGDVPGIESTLVDQIGPGNAMRGQHDPMPVLLVCRDLLARYIEMLDDARPAKGSGARKRVMRVVAETLFEAGVATKDVRAVLESKGIDDISDAALDNLASRLRKRGAQHPVRGGAPRRGRSTQRPAPRSGPSMPGNAALQTQAKRAP
jgi:hypothetical protein